MEQRPKSLEDKVYDFAINWIVGTFICVGLAMLFGILGGCGLNGMDEFTAKLACHDAYCLQAVQAQYHGGPAPVICRKVAWDTVVCQ